MFSRSISATLASPIAQPTQRTLMISASSARSSGRTCFESLSPRKYSGPSRTTTAATTGPASGPRPTSSVPPMKRWPFARAASS